MRFLVRKRRQAPAIIIVALIDILIVLMIFLMVTTTFKQQPSLKLSLPESTQAQRAGAQESPPLVVVIDEKGNLRFGPDARPVTIEHLQDELVAAASKGGEVKLAISADKMAPIGQEIKVLDAAKAAKIKAVSIFAKEAGR